MVQNGTFFFWRYADRSKPYHIWADVEDVPTPHRTSQGGEWTNSNLDGLISLNQFNLSSILMTIFMDYFYGPFLWTINELMA